MLSVPAVTKLLCYVQPKQNSRMRQICVRVRKNTELLNVE